MSTSLLCSPAAEASPRSAHPAAAMVAAALVTCPCQGIRRHSLAQSVPVGWPPEPARGSGRPTGRVPDRTGEAGVSSSGRIVCTLPGLPSPLVLGAARRLLPHAATRAAPGRPSAGVRGQAQRQDSGRPRMPGAEYLAAPALASMCRPGASSPPVRRTPRTRETSLRGDFFQTAVDTWPGSRVNLPSVEVNPLAAQ
jgi:hypothetical protein